MAYDFDPPLIQFFDGEQSKEVLYLQVKVRPEGVELKTKTINIYIHDKDYFASDLDRLRGILYEANLLYGVGQELPNLSSFGLSKIGNLLFKGEFFVVTEKYEEFTYKLIRGIIPVVEAKIQQYNQDVCRMRDLCRNLKAGEGFL